MQRDVLFFVRGIPPDRVIQAKGKVFMHPFDEQLHKQMYESAEPLPALRSFLTQKHGGVMLVGFRNDCADDSSAVTCAWKCLEGIFDGMQLIDGCQPKVCHVVQLRQENAPTAKLMRYAPQMWTQQSRPGSGSPEKWKASRDELAKRLLIFFDMVALGDPKYQNDLGYQIRYSVKMFRCGNDARALGWNTCASFPHWKDLSVALQR